MVTQLVDSEGRRVGRTDSIPFIMVNALLTFTRISEDTFLYIETFKLADSIVFNFVDKNLNTLKLISLKEVFPINDMLLTSYQHMKLIFTSFDTKPIHLNLQSVMSYTIYMGTKLLNAKVNLEYLELYPTTLLYGKEDGIVFILTLCKKVGVGDWDFSMNVYKLSSRHYDADISI